MEEVPGQEVGLDLLYFRGSITEQCFGTGYIQFTVKHKHTDTLARKRHATTTYRNRTVLWEYLISRTKKKILKKTRNGFGNKTFSVVYLNCILEKHHITSLS